MTARHWAGIAAVLLLSCLNCPASAQPSRVEARQVCAVKAAIRFGQRAWTPRECERIADAFNETENPVQSMAIAINESDLRERAINVQPKGVFDVGLMAVRCVTRTFAEDTQDICLNGAARGLTVAKLLDPVVNIRTAAAVLASHGGSLRRYNGGTREHGYGARIGALVAAMGGVEVKVKGKRLRKLVRQIVEAMGKEPRS